MSLQPAPEPKRSKPRENAGVSSVSPVSGESAEARNKRLQRELHAAAAEKRMLASQIVKASPRGERENAGSNSPQQAGMQGFLESTKKPAAENRPLSSTQQIVGEKVYRGKRSADEESQALSIQDAEQLYKMVFGISVSKDILAQWCNQGFRALVLAMAETLLLAGNKHRAVLATLNIQCPRSGDRIDDGQHDEMIAKALEGVSINSASELQKVLRIDTFTSPTGLFHQLQEMLPIFRSRMGALLFLFSALLSRGLEIVNLLLCGQAVSNVFDGRMDLGDGMFLKGVPTTVEVGFLSLLESLNFCKVGQYLKRPKWPIWVVGSGSHYTVLFAFDINVQNENELEDRESRIRKAFDAHDQSGGGGFISSEALQQLLQDMKIDMPRDKLESLCGTDIVVWSEFWQVLLQLDKSMGGLKDSSGLMGRKQFDLYHFNGIAKAVTNNTPSAGEALQQRPRLTRLRVTVPPKWTPEEFLADVSSSHGDGPSGTDGCAESQGHPVLKDEPAQHAPLVDCIRTRWPRAVCNWIGDPPSIV